MARYFKTSPDKLIKAHALFISKETERGHAQGIQRDEV